MEPLSAPKTTPSSAELHLAYKVGNAQINLFPYPHFYVLGIFPPDFYAELQTNLPDPAAMRSIEEVRGLRGYKERFVLELNEASLSSLPEPKKSFWSNLQEWLVGGRFSALVFSKFGSYVEQRFKGKPDLQFYDEALLVQDTTNYKLGPHSDSKHKVITLLFYLPRDESQLHLGTSIYVPKDPRFTCPGGPHYPHDRFDRMYTMPFAPNSLFAFFKTDNSFHGVEPVNDPDCRRWLLLFDIYVNEKPGIEPRQVKFSVKSSS